MKVTLWGTRGSLATPGAETARYGGNTSCVGVVGREGTMLVLDAGNGHPPPGQDHRRIRAPRRHPARPICTWTTSRGSDSSPRSTTPIWRSTSGGRAAPHQPAGAADALPLAAALPGEPARAAVHAHAPRDAQRRSDIGEFRVSSALVCHPGPTVGYRITDARGRVLAYLPDHEPALAPLRFRRCRARGPPEARSRRTRTC